MTDRVLIADDDDALRALLSRVLRLIYPGATIQAVSDGVAALDAAMATPPALLIADVLMPKLSGLELVTQLRARQQTYPMVLLSAHLLHSESDDAGASCFVLKPFTIAGLQATLTALLPP